MRTDSLFFDQTFAERPIVSWDVHPDGKQFVVTREVHQTTTLIIVENWMTQVRERLAAAAAREATP